MSNKPGRPLNPVTAKRLEKLMALEVGEKTRFKGETQDGLRGLREAAKRRGVSLSVSIGDSYAVVTRVK